MKTFRSRGDWSSSSLPATTAVALVLVSLTTLVRRVSSFGVGGQYDRFRSVCPADRSCVRHFDPDILSDDDEDVDERHTWVAVYRSSNNLPSVLLKDDFLNAMNHATSTAVIGATVPGIETKEGNDVVGKDDDDDGSSSVRARAPVAVARLRPGATDSSSWIVDGLRCSLKKEETNPDCDGGSEHAEALSVCVDELIAHFLSTATTSKTDGRTAFVADPRNDLLRCKATLVAAPLFEARGFREIDALDAEMATHAASLDAAMERYASRAVAATTTTDACAARSPGARDRALRVLSLLGQFDASENDDDDTVDSSSASTEEGDDEQEYDPWASIKSYY